MTQEAGIGQPIVSESNAITTATASSSAAETTTTTTNRKEEATGSYLVNLLPPLSVLSQNPLLEGADPRWEPEKKRELRRQFEPSSMETGEEFDSSATTTNEALLLKLSHVYFLHPEAREEESEEQLEEENRCRHVEGHILITTARVVFIATAPEDESWDFLLHGNGIALHALQNPGKEPEDGEEDQFMDHDDDDNNKNSNEYKKEDQGGTDPLLMENWSVYVQLMMNDDDVPREIILCPVVQGDKEEEEKQKQHCQDVFDALSNVLCNSSVAGGEEEGGGGMFPFASMMGLANAMPETQDQDQDDDDMICRINLEDLQATFQMGTPEHEDKMNEEERQEKLQKWDELLVVPPQFQRDSDDGQFEDAE